MLARLQVKNVERIELGRYEMETWYFSPLPPQYKDCKVRSVFYAVRGLQNRQPLTVHPQV